MSKKGKKKKVKITNYPSKEERLHNVEKRLEETKKIQSREEPEGNKEAIASFYKQRNKDKQWQEVRK